MVLIRRCWCEAHLRAPKVMDCSVLLLEDVEYRFVPVLAVWNAMLFTQSHGKFRRVAKIVRIVAVAGGRHEREMVPAAFMGPRDETCDRRLRDNVKCRSLAGMPCRAVDSIKQMRAARTRQLALGSIHEAVQNERVVRAEHLGHLYLLRHCILADPLEYIVFRHLATRRQGAAFGCNRFDLGTQCDLFVQQGVSRGTILGAFVRITDMLHGFPPDCVFGPKNKPNLGV